jgi:hypothetical protein
VVVAILDHATVADHNHCTHLHRRCSAMNPVTKLILDELNKRFTEHKQKWNLRFAELEHESKASTDATASRIQALEHTTQGV